MISALFSVFCPNLPRCFWSFLINLFLFFVYISLVWYLNYLMVAFIFWSYFLVIPVWHEKNRMFLDCLKDQWFWFGLTRNMYIYMHIYICAIYIFLYEFGISQYMAVMGNELFNWQLWRSDITFFSFKYYIFVCTQQGI